MGWLSYLFVIAKRADPAVVEKKFVPVVKKFTDEDMKKYNAAVVYHLQPLTDIHLYSHYMMEPGENGDGKQYIFYWALHFLLSSLHG